MKSAKGFCMKFTYLWPLDIWTIRRRFLSLSTPSIMLAFMLALTLALKLAHCNMAVRF